MSEKFDFPVYFKQTEKTDEILKSVDITRYAVKDGKPDKSVTAMTTDAGMAFIEEGISCWKIDVASERGIEPGDMTPKMVNVKAAWYTAKEAREKGIKVIAGSSANVFSGLGALLVPDGFNIPTVLATKENVKYYGLELIENNHELMITTDKCDIALMKYDYKENYKKEFLMKLHGGGGVFIETHDFPHLHIPTSEKCGGYIVIGKRISADEFNFTAFQIPFNYALYTPANTIHGDGTLVGEYALTVADPKMISADTVLIYNENSETMEEGVVPDWKA
ncbi:MAG: hypothetical protein L3J89_00950 [Gammaproteobacteria bacterium]|nr:hypothetical protein [Gammaproteobacteria bacterium]